MKPLFRKTIFFLVPKPRLLPRSQAGAWERGKKTIIQLISRRWQFVSALLCISMLAGLCFSFFLPRNYLAETSVRIIPEGIPDFLAESDPSIVSQSITRYDFLEQAIRESGLFSYPEYEEMQPDEKVALMRENLSVSMELDENITVTLSLKGRPPVKIAKAVMCVGTYFIEEKIRLISEKLEGVSKLMAEKLKVSNDELNIIETSLNDYRMNNAGSLPEDMKSNMAMLTKLRKQWVTGQRNLSNKKNSQIQLERQIAELRAVMETYTPRVTEEKTFPYRSEDETKLEQMKIQFEKLTARYTPRHPDVIRAKREIAKLEAIIANKAQEKSDSPENKTDLSREIYQKKNEQIKALTSQYETLKKRTAKEENALSDLRYRISIYERRIEDTSRKDQDIKALLMAYQSIKEGISPISEKKKEADLEVEKWRELSRQKFHIPNSAKFFRNPVAPDLMEIFMLSLGTGLGMSLALTMLLELFMGYDPQPDRRKSRIRQIANILFLIITIALIAGFGFLAVKGAGYADYAEPHISDKRTDMMWCLGRESNSHDH